MDMNEIVLKINSKTKTKFVVHAEITKYLKDHQIDGIKFIFENCYEQNSGCILARCMGLGKTLQVIALLHSVISLKEYSTNKILVLCPITTIMNWKDEICRLLAPINDQRKLQIYELEQKDDINRKISYLQKWSQCGSNDPAGCLIMGYESFRSLVNFHSTKVNIKKYRESQLREIRQSIEKHLLRSADIVICDEGHKIKNLNAGITLAVNQIRTGIRIILTGTPMQNHLMEYYSMVNFVKPSFLGTKQHFNSYFAEPIKNGQHADSCTTDIKYMKERSYALNKKLSKIVQRREISLLKDFLPEKFEFVLFVPLTEVQYKLYKYFLDHRGGSIEYKRLFGDYTCLRKIWTHLKVLDNAHQKSIVKKKKIASCDDESCSDNDEDQMGGLESIDNDWWRKVINKSQLESALSSHKIIILFEILKECKRVGEKCVIFSSFVEVLNVVEYFMNEINQQQKDGNLRPGVENFVGPWIKNHDYYRLDGSVPKDRRHSMITNFNDDNNKRIKVFLISAQTGGQGINLFGANRLILLDTSWNPATDQQSIFRIYRMGQEKHCYIYRLLSMGTMEEKIYSRSVTKQAMSCRVVDKQQVDRHYSMNELYELYSLTKTNMAERPVPTLPKDNLLAQLLQKHPDKIYKYLEHDSLLENKVEEELNDAEKNEAWQRFEQNSQSQSLYASSIELQQQILTCSSQNPTIGFAVKSHNQMESNIFNLKKPVAVHMDPKTNSFCPSLDTFLESETIKDVSSENSNDPFVKIEVVQFKEQFSDERENAEVGYSKNPGTDGRGLDNVLVQNPEIDAYSKNEYVSFNEPPMESDTMKEEFSQEVISGQVLDNIMVQSEKVSDYSKTENKFSNEPLKNEDINDEFSQEVTDGLVLDDVLVQNPENESNSSIKPLQGVTIAEKCSQVDQDSKNVTNSFSEPLRNETINDEYSQALIGGRVVDDVSVQNSEEGAFSKNEFNSSIKPMQGVAITEEFSKDDTDFENATNFIMETMGSDFINDAFLERVFDGVLVQNTEVEPDSKNATNETLIINGMNKEFSQQLAGERVINDVSVRNTEVGSYSKNELKSLTKPLPTEAINEEFSQEFIGGRVLADVLMQNAEVGTDLESAANTLNETFGHEVIDDECLDKLSERKTLFDASTSMVDFQSKSLIAEFEEFDKENIVNRTANSLSTFAKGLLHSLNIPCAVPLQQRQLENVLNTIENYSKDKQISRNQSNTFEYKLTFKRPLNSNDQLPVKKLKLSLEIDHTASIAVDKALLTLPFIINERTLFEENTFSGESHEMVQNDNLRIDENKLSESNSVNTNDLETTLKVVERTSENLPKTVGVSVVEPMHTSQAEYDDPQSTSISMTVMNSLDNYSTEDVEMNSICIQKSIIKDNVKEVAPDSFTNEEILKQLNVANNNKQESFEDETMLSHSPQRSEESYEESDEESVDDTVRHFNAGEQKSSVATTHVETPSCLSEIESSSEDEEDLKNYFVSHSTQEVAVYEGSNSSNYQHSVLSSIKRACVLM